MRLLSRHRRLLAVLALGLGGLSVIACQQQDAARAEQNEQQESATMPKSKQLPALVLPTTRPTTPPFLNLPSYAYEALPFLLSQTGAFIDTETLTPVPQLIPFEVNAALWTDAALKQRWIAVPHDPSLPAEDRSAISFTPTGEWYFPSGTVLVK